MTEPTPQRAPRHPLADEFEAASVTWRIIDKPDGGDPVLEFGKADNGLVAVRKIHNDTGAILIYTSSEWKAYVAAVKDGEFDLTQLDDDLQAELEAAIGADTSNG